MSYCKYPPSLRVMLLEDHKMVRRGLELLLEQEHIDVVGSFNTSGELFTALHRQTADVLIVGYSFRSTEADDLKMIRSFLIRSEVQPAASTGA